MREKLLKKREMRSVREWESDLIMLKLDFDFERSCSVCLSKLNVYACLISGKYFQGRSQNSPAYKHSLEAGHHVYMNLLTEKVYCLPDRYEINDPCLDDIRHVLNPRFSRGAQVDRKEQWSRALDGSYYLPGMVGLNNIQNTDFVNVTIQSLMRVTPLRKNLPPPPLFKDVMEKSIIPQVALFDLLKKFDGETATTEVVRPRLARVKYRVTKTPYLMFHMVRFKKNNFFKEKNPTLVNFPVKDMELRDYIPSLPGEKEACTKYNLIANIVHDGKPDDGSFRVFVQPKLQERVWYQMQDLHVVEMLPQMVELSEAYMQIYELQEE
ncbi:unnamed protein product [Eruca vesicaria subsp. sativa]|uniref:U4/U6.U5 tri-snRNP-associated protein 2 n=1 Tax=Eruca vesicaria subsp. sativa TaxID=29727 RepID=A0ABC8KKW6_ERUVS|nr:unnamed protein product [Eruca vesicaria subsp. sativa]